jgi:hypothetical protein
MTPLLPKPDPSDRSSGTGKRSRGRADAGTNIPTVEEILEMLMRLNGLVTLNLISTSQASVIQRGLRTILDEVHKRAQNGLGGLPHEVLAEICRRDPRMIDLLAPLLTDDQVQWLMGEATDGPDDQV